MILAVTHLEVCNRTPVFLQCTYMHVVDDVRTRIDHGHLCQQIGVHTTVHNIIMC